jgi:hypothetical protein
MEKVGLHYEQISRRVAQCLLFCFVTFFGDSASRSKCVNITMQDISQETDQKIASEDSRHLAQCLSLLLCYLPYRLGFTEQACQRHDARNLIKKKIEILPCLSLLPVPSGYNQAPILQQSHERACICPRVALARVTPSVTGSLPMTQLPPESLL